MRSGARRTCGIQEIEDVSEEIDNFEDLRIEGTVILDNWLKE